MRFLAYPDVENSFEFLDPRDQTFGLEAPTHGFPYIGVHGDPHIDWA